MAAHATPPEYKDDDGNAQNDAYIDKVCEWLPILHQEGLVDAFCENILQLTKCDSTAWRWQ
ncbi:hypothetical protein B0682_02630 [Moraxella lincolnii]|uniref:Uncharacterized protein n=1 Tax=Lwoffella lincolnii TaxID=90241 RepID=A0A1T0CH18_9GAMM|nr:hypothetical protein B0682_02630 [Moraxella lincolnii]